MLSMDYLNHWHVRRAAQARSQSRRRWAIRAALMGAVVLITAPLALLTVPVAACYLLVTDRI
mgnify:FL=1